MPKTMLKGPSFLDSGSNVVFGLIINVSVSHYKVGERGATRSGAGAFIYGHILLILGRCHINTEVRPILVENCR